jgi:hypothetical protein
MAQKTHRGQHEPCVKGFAANAERLTEIFGQAIGHGNEFSKFDPRLKEEVCGSVKIRVTSMQIIERKLKKSFIISRAGMC